MPLRDLLVAGVLATTLPFVFRYAYLGVLLWTWVGMMNPHRLGWGFMYSAPVGALVGAITLIALITTRDRVRLPKSPALLVLAIFLIWTCFTTMTAIMVPESVSQLQKVLKIQLFIFITAAVLYKFEHIRLFIWVNVLSIGYFGVKGGLYTLRTAGGGMVLGPPGSFITGNTEIALALVMIIPLLYFLYQTTPHPWLKRGLMVSMGLCALAAVGTQSRGGLVAIAAMSVLLWWRAPHKLRNFVIFAFLAATIWSFMPQSWHERMGTIQTYEEDASAMGRIYAWETTLNVANNHFMGGGYYIYHPTVFDVYAPYAGERRFDSSIARAAHSIYFQVIGEHGYLGFLLFMLFWFLGWRVATRLRRGGTQDNPDDRWMYLFAGMAQVALVGYFTGAAFLSLAYWDLPFNIVIMLIVIERWRQERQTMPEVLPQQAPADLKKRGILQRALWYIRTA